MRQVVIDPLDMNPTVEKGTEHTTALVVARAWSDLTYLQRLVSEPKAVLAEAGYEVGADIDLRVLLDEPGNTHIAVTRQTRDVEALVGVLAPMFPVPRDTEIRIVHSDDQVRYLIVPVKPAGLSATIEAELGMFSKKDPDDTVQIQADVEVASIAAEATGAVTTTAVAAEAWGVVVLT